MDSYDDHAVQCKVLPDFKCMHELVKYVLYVLKRASISAKKEVPVYFLADSLVGGLFNSSASGYPCVWVGMGKTRLYGPYRSVTSCWAKDKQVCCGQPALMTKSNKVAKHEKLCVENQHVFIPFFFCGFLALEATVFLNRA